MMCYERSIQIIKKEMLPSLDALLEQRLREIEEIETGEICERQQQRKQHPL